MQKNMRLASTAINLPKDEDVQQEEEKRQEGEKSKIERIEAWLMARYDFRRNMVLQKIEVKEKVQGTEWHVMEDAEENDLLYELNKANFTKPEGMMNVILGSSRIETYNPIDEYFSHNELRTMGNIRRLMNCVELNPTIDQLYDGRTYRQIFEEYFVKWLKACYICMTGKKFNDVMLLLVGPQGTHKTSFLNHLTPPELAAYSHTGHIEPTLSNYLTASYLVEKVFINVDDQMENIFGKDYNSMKSIISQDIVTRRMLYRRHSTQQRRIANFCGSVNETGFLMDSNNRRYLCFQVANISTEYSNVDIGQLWAEVAQLVEEDNGSVYVFKQHDYEIIDLIDENCAAPIEEGELLNSCFEPATAHEQWTYYMQFSEIMKELKYVSDNMSLKQYNLKTAMRRYKFNSQPVRRTERGNMPYRLYAVKIKKGSPYTDILIDRCKNYRDPHEWPMPGEPL